MTAQQGAWEGEVVRAAVRDVIDGNAPNPALQANVPTRAEKERESEGLVARALARAASEIAWAKRHSDEPALITRVGQRVMYLLDQREVYVVRYEACECAGDDRLFMSSWHVSEAAVTP